MSRGGGKKSRTQAMELSSCTCCSRNLTPSLTLYHKNNIVKNQNFINPTELGGKRKT